MAIQGLGQKGIYFAHDEKQVAGESSTTQRQPSQRSLIDLKAALNSEKYWIRQKAADDLGEMGKEAAPLVPDLISLLSINDNIYNSFVATLTRLGIEAPDIVIPELVKALNSNRDFTIRSAAAITLGRIGVDAKAAVPALTKALSDHDEFVREKAALALRKI